MKDNLSQLHATQLLDSINQSRTAMRAAIPAYSGHRYLWRWDVIRFLWRC